MISRHYPILNKYIPHLFNRIQHYRIHKKFGGTPYWADLDSPKTFNEKLLWLKLNVNNDSLKTFGDKFEVRKYVQEKIGTSYLIELIDVFNDVEEFSLNKYPNSFVIKPNHSSGMIEFIKNKEKVNFDDVIIKMKKWLDVDFHLQSGEGHYDVPKRILIEPLIAELADMVDFKFYCFNGEAKYVQIITGRGSSLSKVYKNFNWSNAFFQRPNFKKFDIEMPNNLDELIVIVEKICPKIPFCRVDFYYSKRDFIFSEITLYPGSGFLPFRSYEEDLKLGEELMIPY
jgi:hypothetical protein